MIDYEVLVSELWLQAFALTSVSILRMVQSFQDETEMRLFGFESNFQFCIAICSVVLVKCFTMTCLFVFVLSCCVEMF